LHGYLILIFVPSPIFAPSVDEYPHLASLLCNAGDEVGTAEVGPSGQQVGSDKDRVRRSISLMWHQLQIVQDTINHWTYVAEYESLPATIYDLWRHHISSGTVDAFIDVLEGGIRDGYAHIQSLMNIMPNSIESDLDLKDWSDQVAQWFFIICRAMARLQITLDLVKAGLVHKYPSILQLKVIPSVY
jgi:hypothetical protein